MSLFLLETLRDRLISLWLRPPSLWREKRRFHKSITELYTTMFPFMLVPLVALFRA